MGEDESKGGKTLMKIVIDIDDDDYQFIKDTEFENHVVTGHLYEAVYNGTPLPKHHGRIADLSAVYEDICNGINAMTRIGVAIDGDWLWAKLNDAIDNAPTIIEADRGEVIANDK